tara:strand:+ start:133 stop:357 length:225 start_codon:yes stop_codon:yes gene_type:complete
MSVVFDKKFLYSEQQSYEENFQRWWLMDTVEKETYIKHWKSKEVIYTEEQARNVFDDLFADCFDDPVADINSPC